MAGSLHTAAFGPGPLTLRAPAPQLPGRAGCGTGGARRRRRRCPPPAPAASTSSRSPAVLGAASLAAAVTLVGLGVTWHRAAQQSRQRQQQQQQQQQRSPPGSSPASRRSSSGPSKEGDGWASQRGPLQLRLPGGWLLTRSTSSLDEECDAIEAAQQEEALEAMQRWDSRFELRNKSLPELRALAQRHQIAGRSRMRKQELIAALERVLGDSPRGQ